MEVWACVRVGSLESSVGGGPGVAKETRAGGAALLCRANLRVVWGEPERARLSRGRPELNRGYASCRGDGASRLAPSRHLEGAGNLLGLAGLVRSTKSRAIKTQEVQSDSLVFEGGLFFVVYLNECCGAESRK